MSTTLSKVSRAQERDEVQPPQQGGVAQVCGEGCNESVILISFPDLSDNGQMLPEVPVGNTLLLPHGEDGSFITREIHRVDPPHSLCVVGNLL